MIGITINELRHYGCPNCGNISCRNISNNITSPEMVFTCNNCRQTFAVKPDDQEIKPEDCMTVAAYRPKEDIVEAPTYIKHPRTGIPAWQYEPRDEPPESGGEYVNPIMIDEYMITLIARCSDARKRIEKMLEIGSDDKYHNKASTKYGAYGTFTKLTLRDLFYAEEMYYLILENNFVLTQDIIDNTRKNDANTKFIEENGIYAFKVRNRKLQPLDLFKDNNLHDGDVIWVEGDKSSHTVMNTYRAGYDIFIFVVNEDTGGFDAIKINRFHKDRKIYLIKRNEFYDCRKVLAKTADPHIFITVIINPNNKEEIRKGWKNTFFPMEDIDKLTEEWQKDHLSCIIIM